jgi:hypothetical protein
MQDLTKKSEELAERRAKIEERLADRQARVAELREIAGQRDLTDQEKTDLKIAENGELIELIIEKYSNGKITILNTDEKEKNTDVVNELIQIINVFSSRINGLKKYTKSIKDEIKENNII